MPYRQTRKGRSQVIIWIMQALVILCHFLARFNLITSSKYLYIPPLVGTNHRKGTIIFRLHCYVMKLLNHAFIWLCNMISGSCTLVLPSGSSKPIILILHEQQRSNSITAMNWQASRLSSICTSSDGASRKSSDGAKCNQTFSPPWIALALDLFVYG